MIKILSSEDYEAYSTLRALGLVTDPSASWASEEEESPIRKTRFQSNINHSDNFMMGCFENNELVSIAGFTREEKLKLKHKGSIWGVYTHPNHRGKGFGGKLMQAMIDKAFLQDGLNQIKLSTSADNFGAIRLYQKLGFKIYGTELKSSLVNGQFYDEVFMKKFKN